MEAMRLVDIPGSGVFRSHRDKGPQSLVRLVAAAPFSSLHLTRAAKPWDSTTRRRVEVDEAVIVTIRTEVENVAVTSHQAQSGIACVAKIMGLPLTLRPPVKFPEDSDGGSGFDDLIFHRTEIMPLDPGLHDGELGRQAGAWFSP